MGARKPEASWRTSAKFSRESIEITTENRPLAIVVVALVVLVVGLFAITLVAREYLPLVGRFISSWAGSTFAMLLLGGMLGYMESQSRSRKPGRIFRWAGRNPALTVIVAAGLGLLLALGQMTNQ